MQISAAENTPKDITLVRYTHWLLLGVITFIVFGNGISFGLTNWDDPEYILQNPLLNNFTAIWSRFWMGNYHPLTILSYAMEQKIAGGPAPALHHFVNILLHAITGIMVLKLLVRWIGSVFHTKIKDDFILQAGLIGTVIFIIHPLRVESVIWVSERKDVLYVLFSILAVLSYDNWCIATATHHKNNNSFFQSKYGRLTLLYFLLACLSKGMAVSVPPLLLAVALFRKPQATIWPHQLFLWAIALCVGIVALRAQQSGGAIPGAEHEMYTFIDRLCIAGYNIFFYLFKVSWPLSLSALYPYPQHLSIAHYLSPVALILLFAVISWYGIRYRQPLLLLGSFWFIITIAPVLQLLPVGHAIAADRYTYLPAVGISLLISMAAALLLQQLSKQSQLLSITAGIICILLAFQTFRQVNIWENSFSLWSHSLTVCPTADLAWYNRGQIHYEQKNYAAALADYTRAAELVAHLPNKGADALNNQGLSLQQLARPAEAVAAHSLAIQKLPNYTIAFYNRGNAYQLLNQFDSAKADYRQTIRLQPDYAPAWFNLGVTFQQLGEIDSAFYCYSQSINLAPKNAAAYINRGNLYYKQGKIEQALTDFETAVSLEPQNNNYIRNRDLAQKRLQGSTTGNVEMAKAANEAGLAFAQKQQYANALREFSRALVLDSSQGGYFYNRALAYHFLGKNDSARIDAIHAQKLGFKGFDPKFLHNIGIK